MKKTALLLGAVLAVSSSAFAKEVLPVVEEVKEPVVMEEVKPEPLFKSVKVGQSLEVDNTSGNENIGEEVAFMNTVDLSTENWDYMIGAGRLFSSDTRDKDKEGGLYHRGASRMELQAIRNFDNWFLGAKVRSEDNYDRWYLRTGYDYGMFSGWMDAQYYSIDKEQDFARFEVMPLNIMFGPIKVGYYADYKKYTGKGDADNNNLKSTLEHQLRAYAPIYTGDKLSLSLEYRLGLHQSRDYKEKTAYKRYKDFNYNALGLNANYALTDALDIYGSYRYDIKKYEVRDGKEADLDKGLKSDKYYGEFVIGWSYQF